MTKCPICRVPGRARRIVDVVENGTRLCVPHAAAQEAHEQEARDIAEAKDWMRSIETGEMRSIETEKELPDPSDEQRIATAILFLGGLSQRFQLGDRSDIERRLQELVQLRCVGTSRKSFDLFAPLAMLDRSVAEDDYDPPVALALFALQRVDIEARPYTEILNDWETDSREEALDKTCCFKSMFGLFRDDGSLSSSNLRYNYRATPLPRMGDPRTHEGTPDS
jgi:hypothetical protein